LHADTVIAPSDQLHVAHRKRMSFAYVTSESGVRELQIYYGAKEVCFDEEHLFPWGEALVGHGSFTAESATAWGPGYAWDEIRPLLEALVAEGIVKRGEPSHDARGGGLVASQVPASVCPFARTWSAADCEAISRDLGGRAIEIGYLEAFLSVYRIAHPALDADDRQVGEANTFPIGLRLDRDTEWRVCQYPGSRYRDDMPMNVTALKAMIKHWKPIMVTLRAVRSELARRLPRCRTGWTVGDLHLFSGIALSLPAFQLMRGGAASPQPPIHPVLSSLFRITDGIRMATHLMLFLSQERTRKPAEPTTATDLYEFVERNGMFLSPHGVCAGPKPLIDEFLAVIFDGSEAQGGDAMALPPEVQALVDQLPEVFDYALLGLQSWAVSRSVWLAMSRAYRAIRALLEARAGDRGIAAQLRDRVRADWTKLGRQRIADDHEHDVHVDVYTDTYEQSWRALRRPLGPPTLAAVVAPVAEGPAHRVAAGQLRELLAVRLAGSELAGDVDHLVATLVHYLREEQAILGATEAIQAAINAMLGRPVPTRPLTARDLRVNLTMYGGVIAEFMYLFDMLEHELGFHVTCSAAAIEVSDLRSPRDSREIGNLAGPTIDLQQERERSAL
jgi:hypothetical protein